MKDIRVAPGTPRDGQAYKSYGLVETVEHSGPGQENYYETVKEAYEYVQKLRDE